MATVIVKLNDGFKIGDVVHLEAEIREASSGDIIEAMEDSERVVMLPGSDRQEPVLVASPTMVGIHTLRRQIVRIGDYQGPLTLAEIKRLSPIDLDVLQKHADLLETAGLAPVTDRGRVAGGQGTD